MRLPILVPLALLALTVPPGARAQSTSEFDTATVAYGEDVSPERHFMFNVGGGISFPLSDAGDRFEMGGGFQVGVGFQFMRRLGVTAEYLYTAYDVKSDVLDATSVEGDHYMQYGTLNAVVNLLPRSPLGIYLIGGPGLYYRKVEVSQFAGTAVVPYCDPWLYYCTTSVVPVSEVLGSRSSTDFGLNAGAGITFSLYGDLRFYLEGRYHYIFGPEFTGADGNSRNANGQYVPLMFGLRY
ncbi:outer membrane beta-barrel protein [Myxococcus sp. RHSTA-1-4]|uniref:outer membrane beta-barrel protein n=1 Tax=Myxococcus sp. RHSTA-1-4 TaxID=2874601 RepID=UPI001CBDF13B|nr:outer membrane beta-barrel protein [Myxococcus sp. RHSTA-1-4]MBZ4420203.1 outer membrane beta-barrel protein [Myxococcus sp. RHSTA-1-4]